MRLAAAALAIVLLLAGCARPPIVAATEAAFPPFNDLDDAGDLVGFEIDLMREIGDHLGRDVNFVVQPEFARLFEEIDEARADVIASTVSVTPEREARYHFTRPYFETGVGVLMRRGESVSISDVRGQRVGAAAGTTSVDAARRLGAALVVEFQFSNDAVAALEAREIDAYLVDLVEAAILASPGVALMPEPASIESYALLTSDPVLAGQLDDALAHLEASGRLLELLILHGLR